MNNLDCSICGSTSFTEIGGLPVCEDCFYSMQENDLSDIRIAVEKLQKKPTDIFDIIEETVCCHTGVSPETLNSKTRKREVVLSRQLCHHFGLKMTKKSFSVVGKRFGNKDHTTAMHSDKTIKNLRETDKDFKKEYEQILSKF